MAKITRTKYKVEFGDFQTPRSLTQEISKALFEMGIKPKTIIEPTCGEGNFLLSAVNQFPGFENAIGYDINPKYVEATKTNLENIVFAKKVSVQTGDFFAIDWKTRLNDVPTPILVIGNPPWVTNSRLGVLSSTNLPQKSNFQQHSGLLALTGKSNFDISEWMLLKILDWLNGKYGTLAMLCKNSVARKVLAYAWKHNYQIAESREYLIDVPSHFDATVDACLLVCSFKPDMRNTKCKIYSSLQSKFPASEIGYKSGLLIANTDYYDKWHHLFGMGAPWRSGIKHDCSKIMELKKADDCYINGLGEKVELEDLYLFPMLKSSELVHGRQPTRWMLVTQKGIGEDTSRIQERAPKTWKYLIEHAEHFAKRGSIIYKNKPPFSIFGVGDYSFAPWKVAISALYKQLEFTIVGSIAGKPIVLDDTQNLLPCHSYAEAKRTIEILNSSAAKEFYQAFIFWDEKRPITINLLKYLDISKLSGFSEQYLLAA